MSSGQSRWTDVLCHHGISVSLKQRSRVWTQQQGTEDRYTWWEKWHKSDPQQEGVLFLADESAFDVCARAVHEEERGMREVMSITKASVNIRVSVWR